MTKEHSTQSVPAPAQAPAEEGNGLAIASLVLGILSLTGFFIFTGVPAIITGIISLRKKQKERGMSIAGIIMGSIGTLLSFFFVLALIFIIGWGIMSDPSHMQVNPTFDMDMPVESSQT
jgi:amino acid transporter